MKKFFISGIGTEIGKTVMSALVCENLKADYWKPIQAGDLVYTDSHKIQEYCSYDVQIHPERYALQTPMSPHAAAAKEGIEIKLQDFSLPETDNHLIVEGAGGLMVPINDEGDLIVDLIKHLDIPLILVSQNYLGSINHTLMSIATARHYNIAIEGIIFNGPKQETSESYILKHSGLRCIGRINTFEINEANIIEQAAKLDL